MSRKTRARAPKPPTQPKFVVFVDANVFLELYEHLDPQVAQLPSKLAAIGDSLFITAQVADEVARGKLRVAQRAIKRISELRPPSGALPASLQNHASKLRKAIATLQTILDAVRASAVEHLDAVARSEDALSVALAPHMASASKPLAPCLKRARLRRELGNPPGKVGGPLGDQISCEQLLERAKDADRLWLITGDGDYLEGDGSGTHPYRLNPLLFEDLRRASPSITLSLYGKAPADFANAINDFLREHGDANHRFTEEQVAYFDHLERLAEDDRKPWECARDSENTPIESAICVRCETDLVDGLGEDQYGVRRSRGGYVLTFFDHDGDGHDAYCQKCNGKVFEVEFANLCSYCQHVYDSM